jgi:hypothetical protein
MVGTKGYARHESNFVFAKQKEGYGQEEIAQLFKAEFPRRISRGRVVAEEFGKNQVRYILNTQKYQQSVHFPQRSSQI